MNAHTNKVALIVGVILAIAVVGALLWRLVPAGGAMMIDCVGNEATNLNCYEAMYRQIITTKGVDAAFADIKDRYDTSPYVKTTCHPLMHILGRIAAESADTVSEAFKQGDSFCWSGYYHGVLETFAAKIGRENIRENMDTMCAGLNADGKYGFDYYNCVHGLGHGLMAVYDDKLFESLDYCGGLSGQWEKLSCASGVYMENIVNDAASHASKYLDPKRPHYPCDESPEVYKNTCYLMQTSYMLTLNGGNFKKTFTLCREAGKGYEVSCLQSLGRDASGHTVSDAKKTHDICMLGSDYTEQSNCVIGAAKDFISYFHSDKQAKAFCGLFDDALESVCLDTVRSYYATF